MSIKVWVVQADHPRVPGRPLLVCINKARADAEAASLMQLIAKDFHYDKPITAKNWEVALAALTRKHDSDDFSVWIVETELLQ